MTDDVGERNRGDGVFRRHDGNRRTDKRRSEERPEDSTRRDGGERRLYDDGLPSRLSPAKHAFVRTVVIRNKRGLHARAAAKFVTEAGSFAATVTVKRGDMSVSGNSIMGLMMLAAGPSCEIEITTSGAGAEKALNALCDIVEARFGED